MTQVELGNQRDETIGGNDFAVALQSGENFVVALTHSILDGLSIQTHTPLLQRPFYPAQH
ncbi:hypothetical protein D3C81_1894340 [compost metagenome]